MELMESNKKIKIIVYFIWELPEADPQKELVLKLILDVKTIPPKRETRCFTVKNTMCVKAVSLILRNPKNLRNLRNLRSLRSPENKKIKNNNFL